MNDEQVLERLAATDLLAPGTDMPQTAWSRDAARSEIERRIGMQTKERVLQRTQRRRTGWLVAAAAFVVVVVLGVAGALLLDRGEGGVVATTEAPTPTTVPITLAPQFDLTGTYAGELYNWLDELHSTDGVEFAHIRIPMVAWLDLVGDGDEYTGDLVLSEDAVELLADGRFRHGDSQPIDDPPDLTRMPIDVVVAGDQLAVSWDPTVGPLDNPAWPCRFVEVTLTFTVQDDGDRLTLTSGSFTRGTGCGGEDEFVGPVPFVSGSIVRGAAPMP